MNTGEIKWFNPMKNFGFIVPDGGGKDIFVHQSDVKSGGGYAALREGDRVQYEVGSNSNGACAIAVELVETKG